MQWTGAWNVDRMLSEFRQPLGDTQNKGLLLYQYENTWRLQKIHILLNFLVLRQRIVKTILKKEVICT